MRRRVWPIALGLVGILVAAASAYLFWATKAAEPRYSGAYRFDELSAEVTVRFGAHAVPTIEASRATDLIFAQGFVVASERMWQMDLMRRLAQGRLAEVMGEPPLAVDRFFRAIGLGAVARASLTALEPSYRELLRAYAAGVNAYLREARNRLPLEYRLAGIKPEPWQPEDSLAVAAYMSWKLSFNAREELTFLRLAARLGNQRAAELFPTDEGVPAPPPDPDLPQLSAGLAAGLAKVVSLPARYGLPIPGAASNAWAVTGHRTADGAAMLANDPHLAASMPGTWYELELKAPGLHVAGVALPGVPLVIIGHNADLAWGFTTTMADTQDLFVERLIPDSHEVMRPNGGRERINKRVEQIAVAGWDTPFAQTIRSTSHGVILNDVLTPGADTTVGLPTLQTDHLIALRWTAEVVDRSFAAFYKLSTATSIPAARAAIGDFRLASQNLMLAHRDGGIGWQVSGVLPRRGRGHGTFPLPGWTADSAWQGYVPVQDNPGDEDPPALELITANHRTVPLDHPVQVGRAWMAPYRARRIAELLARAAPLSVADLAAMQLDRVSVQARHYQRSLRRLAPALRRADPEAWAIAEQLLAWDGDMDPGSRAAALLVRLERALYESLYGDEFGDDLALLMDLSTSTYDPLQETVRSGESSFWDDVGTPEREHPWQIWSQALRAAAAAADGRQLGELRTLTFRHAFDQMPVLGRFFNVGPLAIGGYSHTVNVAKGSPQTPELAVFVPSLRVVYTPSDWSGTRGVLPLGQSGHRFSRYRTDQLDDWREGRTHRWPWGGPRRGELIGTLELKPRR